MAPEQSISSSGETLPELPHIQDEALRTRVLTHKSLAAAPVNRGLDFEEPENNERLAFLGSHILTQVVSAKLYDIRPLLSKGDLTVSV
jgi:dsRNA-specific ribonuclease